MPSITTWNRLEPRLSGDDLEKGLEARVHDPLWMLARQWQLGELQGEDAGSPIDVRVTTRSAKIDRYKPHAARDWRAYDAAARPLEALVEAEAAPLDLREAADAGQHLIDLLRDDPSIRAALRRAFAFEPVDVDADAVSPAEARLIRQLVGRAIDGRRVHAKLLESSATEPLDIDPALDADERARLDAALGRWRTWFDARHPDAGTSAVAEAWDPHRLEYRFGLRSSAAGVELAAAEYTGKHLDWYAFDVASDDFASRLDVETRVGERPDPWVSIEALEDPGHEILTQTHRVIPTPLGVPGQPASRWWEFEDRRVGFGNLDAKSTDLSTLILLEYALAYGDDWYLVALDQAVGTWCETANLQVTNTFGETLSVVPARSLRRDSPWTLYTPSGVEKETDREFLFLPPSLPPTRLESRPLESVHFRRDEMANLAWGIEQRVQQITGRPIDRQELVDETTRTRTVASRARAPDTATGDGAGGPDRARPADATDADAPELSWRLGTPPPAAWYPLVAVDAGGERRLRLTRTLLADGRVQDAPLGRLLAEIEASEGAHVEREELEQDGGMAVHRTLQVGRWIGGSRHRWRGRTKRLGAADANSGLRFDAVDAPTRRSRS